MKYLSSGRRRIYISELFASVLVNILLIFGAVICVLPVLHILAVSFSANGPANANLVGLWPIQFNIRAYSEVARDTKMVTALVQSFRRILLGVPVNMLLTILCAYPLSHYKKEFPLFWGGCDALKSEAAKVVWTDLPKHIVIYTENCAK